MYEPNPNPAPNPQTPPTPEPAPKPPKEPAEPEKIALTPAELDAKIQAALTEQQRKADAKAAKDKADADRKAAEEQGEFKKLADTEKARADAAEAKAKKLERDAALRDHLAEKHPDYATCAKYIAPLIPADVEGDALTKAIETAAADYVKDNPRTPKGSAAAPAGVVRQSGRGLSSTARTPRNGKSRFSGETAYL